VTSAGIVCASVVVMLLALDITAAVSPPSITTTAAAAAGEDGDDDVILASLNTTLKPASTGDIEFCSYKPAQCAHYVPRTIHGPRNDFIVTGAKGQLLHKNIQVGPYKIYTISPYRGIRGGPGPSWQSCPPPQFLGL